MSKAVKPVKIKWRISEKPTGPYRSFQKRHWPSAYYSNKIPCASLDCSTQYSATSVKIGCHSEITVRVADHSQKPWQLRTLKARAKTLAEAKQMVADFIKKYPHYIPEELRNETKV